MSKSTGKLLEPDTYDTSRSPMEQCPPLGNTSLKHVNELLQTHYLYYSHDWQHVSLIVARKPEWQLENVLDAPYIMQCVHHKTHSIAVFDIQADSLNQLLERIPLDLSKFVLINWAKVRETEQAGKL